MLSFNSVPQLIRGTMYLVGNDGSVSSLFFLRFLDVSRGTYSSIKYAQRSILFAYMQIFS